MNLDVLHESIMTASKSFDMWKRPGLLPIPSVHVHVNRDMPKSHKKKLGEMAMAMKIGAVGKLVITTELSYAF